MIINNPTNVEVSITILGDPYSVKANDFKEVPEEIGTAWMAIHGFLTKGKAEVKEVKKEVKREVKEDKIKE